MSERGTRPVTTTRLFVAVITVILAGQIALSHAISVGEQPGGVPELQTLPVQIGKWTLQDDKSLEQAVSEYLQPDDYILRDYVSKEHSASINLFVAYFKSLQNSYGPHSPRVCLPGSGWLTQSWAVTMLPLDGTPAEVPVNQYVLEKNGQRILVLYWYQNDRRVWAEEFRAKLYLLPDLLRYRRSDVSLVRVISPLGRERSLQESLRYSTEFARKLFPLLIERLGKAG